MNVGKLFVAVLCLVVAVAAEKQCSPLMGFGSEEGLLCTVVKNGVSETVDADDCHKHKDCCKIGEGETAVCYAQLNHERLSAATANARTVDDSDDLYKKALKMKRDSARFLHLRPPAFPGCPQPIPFPASCNPQMNEPYVLDPPVDIPYCVRIPCSVDNAELDTDHHLCGSQPGCYFDKELFDFREAFGPSVLPGVPVCHMAIRNAVFQQKAQLVVKEHGIWNPYFTNCILQEFQLEMKTPKGCELLPILDVFHVRPKLAGWKNINPRECSLIDGCFRYGYGCFYSVDISNVRVKSGQRQVAFNKHEIIFGRPRCQIFDTSSPVRILLSYHQCLSAGCTVDSSITTNYFHNLFAVGEDMTVDKHWDYWTGVQKGEIGAYNIDDRIINFEYTTDDKNNSKPTTSPKTNNPFELSSENPFALPASSFPPSPSMHMITGKSEACGHIFKPYGARPCSPPVVPQLPFNSYCPYKPFHVPRFAPLKGRFDGCCDVNLCYLPKSEILKMHSGPSHYYTEWSMFSACSATCGEGQKRRYRKCVSEDKSRCTEPLVKVSRCNDQPCASWSPWGQYSPCPNTCYPGGVQTRRRVCRPASGFCLGDSEQVQSCNEHPCDYDTPAGRWTSWNQEACIYNRFTKTCEETRTRYCTYNGLPGGKCRGSSLETKKYRCSGCPNKRG
uniref:uncharacterized protein LOC120327758 isoform X2 n=1 Tax=Styela clava TaxID=7725 RepID=UPI00193A34E7|nr:uncharacterized protein LOC120327758 isoform X2 [Styela clava]